MKTLLNEEVNLVTGATCDIYGCTKSTDFNAFELSYGVARLVAGVVIAAVVIKEVSSGAPVFALNNVIAGAIAGGFIGSGLGSILDEVYNHG